MGSILNKIKGKLMKAEGKATNDPVRKAEGSAVEGFGKAQGKVERAARKVKAGVRKAKRKGTAARRTP